MLRASGDTSWVHTAEDFARWLDLHADDIFIGPPSTYRAMSLAELDRTDTKEAGLMRGTFLERWQSGGGFPVRLSVLEHAVRSGASVTYVGACPYCSATITATLHDLRMTCPKCGAHLAGDEPGPRQ